MKGSAQAEPFWIEIQTSASYDESRPTQFAASEMGWGARRVRLLALPMVGTFQVRRLGMLSSRH